MFNQSPIETLASYAIAFAAGAVSVVLITAYGQWMEHKGRCRTPHSHVPAGH